MAAAIAEMRNAIPKKTSEMSGLSQEINALLHESDVQQRIQKLAQCSFTIVAEFEKISRDEGLGVIRFYFQSTLTRVRDEMIRIVNESGL